MNLSNSTANYEVIRYLLDNYYASGINPDDSELVSSHWKHYSNYFGVETNSKGELVSLSGTAFGVCQWTGLAHRALDQACVLSHLLQIPHGREILTLKPLALRICNAMGIDPTLDVYRQVFSLDLLRRNLPHELLSNRIYFVMIGDGYGVLSALIKSVFPNSTIAMVDIGKTLLFQAHYCHKVFPKAEHKLFDSITDLDQADFVYCPTEKLDSLGHFKFDVAVNIASFQEMNMGTVARYFGFLRKSLNHNNRFYCCNRESKTLMGGEVSEFFEYPWKDTDQHLINQKCPWHRYFFSWVQSKDGPSMFGIRLPLVNYYDGMIFHRLTILGTD